MHPPANVLVPAVVAAHVVAIAISESHFNADKKGRPIDPAIHQLAHQVSGKGDSTLVFLHGWPDDPMLFQSTVQHCIKKTNPYRCVNVCLPNYPPPPGFVPACLPERNYGFDLDEAATLLYATIRKTCTNGQHVTLVIHDWGCIVGYLLLSKYRVDRIISLDVGWFIEKSVAPLAIPGKLVALSAVLAYQTLLNCFFMMPTVIGDFFTSMEAKLLRRTPAEGAGPVVAASTFNIFLKAFG